MAKTKKEKAADKELLETIRKRFGVMKDAEDRNRRAAMEDMKFVNVPGAQWDDNMKVERGERPCYEFNKLRVTCKRIINEMRANRPQGKVRGVEDSDKDTAEVYEGLIRNIWNQADGDSIVDLAAEYQVSGGMGAWRIDTEYADDNGFEQNIVPKPIHNPFCLYGDPASRDIMKRDAEDWILTEKMTKKAFEAKYGKIEQVSWEETEFDDGSDWEDDESIRVAEYWWKEPTTKEILQLDDGKVIDADSDEAALIDPETIKNRRTVKSHDIKMCIASGSAILEKPTKWAGRLFPFVVVYGEYMIIDGRVEWFGVPRFAKDAQRSYNISRTSIAETIAGAPLAKFWATATQASGHTKKWAEAHQKNYPFQLFNPDPMQPGVPQRMGGADVPVALIQEAQIASEEIKAVTGIFSADVGGANNATSGRQEIARQQQGQIATFNYQDNIAKGIQRTWEILVDLIPQIYDTERTLRILGADDSEDYVKINTFEMNEKGQQVKVHDLAEGSYDVTITVGPGFATKRQEATEAYAALLQGNPEIMGFAGDLIFKSMDLPYAEDIGERYKAMLPPQIQQFLDKDAKVPPEVQRMMEQAEQAMQQVQAMSQEVQQAAMEADKEKSLNEKEKAEIRTEVERVKAAKAEFDAHIAKEEQRLTKVMTDITLANNKIGDGAGVLELAAAQEAMMQEVSRTFKAIDMMAQDFAGFALKAKDEIAEKVEVKPKVIKIESYRENGNLVAVPVYEEPDQDAPGRNET